MNAQICLQNLDTLFATVLLLCYSMVLFQYGKLSGYRCFQTVINENRTTRQSTETYIIKLDLRPGSKL